MLHTEPSVALLMLSTYRCNEENPLLEEGFPTYLSCLPLSPDLPRLGDILVAHPRPSLSKSVQFSRVSPSPSISNEAQRDVVRKQGVGLHGRPLTLPLREGFPIIPPTSERHRQDVVVSRSLGDRPDLLPSKHERV